MSERNNDLVRSDGSRITLEEIFSRVTLVEPGIVRYHEIAHGTPQALALFTDQIRELGADFERYVLIVDLTDATYPGADYREDLVDWMRTVTSFHLCFIPPAGSANRVTLRFMIARADISMSYHSDLKDAVEYARQKLKEEEASGAIPST